MVFKVVLESFTLQRTGNQILMKKQKVRSLDIPRT